MDTRPRYDPNEPIWQGNCPCAGPAWPCAVCGAAAARFYHGDLIWLCRVCDAPAEYTNANAKAWTALLRSKGIKELWLS